MKLISKATLIALVGGLLAFGTGCAKEGLPAGKSPEDVVREALLNQKQITKMIFEVEIKADLEGEVDGEHNALKGSILIKGTGDEDAGTMQLSLAVDGTMNDEALKMDAEMRANEDGVFANLSNVSISDDEIQNIIDEFAKDYLDKWIKLSFINTEDVTEAGYADIDFDESDPLPFKNLEYVGNTNILGVNSYHFTAEVDEKLLLDMMDVEDLADAQEFFDVVDLKGHVYVSVKDMMLTGFAGTANIDDEEMKGTVEISFKMNPTKADAVRTPAYEEEITEEDLMMLMFGGAMMPMDMDMYDDPGMDFDYDYDYDLDFDEEEFLLELEKLQEMEGIDFDFDM